MMKFKYPLAKPIITQDDINSVVQVLKTPYLSLGPKLKEFEDAFAKYIGVKYAAAVNSGTSALHLSMLALNIGPGDEVITTPFSFIASANSILSVNAKPVFVDISPDTLNIDPTKIERAINERTKAILIVDIFGLPNQVEEIQKITKKHNLYLVEDACEALGATYDGKKCGSFGILSCFGFYPNKQITTGEGGMVCSNNLTLLRLVQSLRNQGRSPTASWLEHKILGYNFRLDELSCALGLSQLKRIDTILKQRNLIADLYNEKLKDIEEITTLKSSFNNKLVRSWFVYVVLLKNKRWRNRIISELSAKGIQTNTYFPAIHLQKFYKEKFGYKKGDFPVAEDISSRTLALPFYNSLTKKDIDYIVSSLKFALYKVKKL